MRKRRAFLALVVLPALLAGMTLAGPPAAAEDLTEGDVELDRTSGWQGDAFAVDITRSSGDFSAWGDLECVFGEGIDIGSCAAQAAPNENVITVDITILESEEAQPGERTVMINDDSSTPNTIVCTDCFTINGPTEVEKGEGEQGEGEQGETGIEITIHGNGFDEFEGTETQSVECVFVDEEGDDETITFDEECDFDSESPAEQLNATISISEEAEPGLRDLRVDLFESDPPDGDPLVSATCFGCFEVTSQDPDPTPTPTPTPTAAPEDDFDDGTFVASEEDENAPAPRLPATGPKEPFPATGGGLTTAVLLVGGIALAGVLAARRSRPHDVTEDP